MAEAFQAARNILPQSRRQIEQIIAQFLDPVCAASAKPLPPFMAWSFPCLTGIPRNEFELCSVHRCPIFRLHRLADRVAWGKLKQAQSSKRLSYESGKIE